MVCADFAEGLPQRMIVRVFRKQQRPHVSISGKADSEKVMYLAFEPTRAAKDITNRGRDLVVAAEHPYHQPGFGFIAVEVVDQFKGILKIQRRYRLQEKSSAPERLCRIPDARDRNDYGPKAPCHSCLVPSKRRVRELLEHYCFQFLYFHFSLRLRDSFEAAQQVPLLTTGDLILKSEQPLNEGFGPGRTPWNYDIHRDDKMSSGHYRILLLILERTAGNGTVTHRNAPLRIRHLVPKHLNSRGHLFGDGSSYDHDVGLARRGPEDTCPETVQVEARSPRSHHLDRAARQAERHWPQRIGAREVQNIVKESELDYRSARFSHLLFHSKTPFRQA